MILERYERYVGILLADGQTSYCLLVLPV